MIVQGFFKERRYLKVEQILVVFGFVTYLLPSQVHRLKVMPSFLSQNAR